jgi:hypothetical protein
MRFASIAIVSLILISCISKKQNKKNFDVLHFVPTSPKELVTLGFERSLNQQTFYKKLVGDTMLMIYFPTDTQYLKAIQYLREKFDTVKLYSFFKSIDPTMEDSSQRVMVKLPKLGMTPHKLYKDEKSIVIYYSTPNLDVSWGSRRDLK